MPTIWLLNALSDCGPEDLIKTFFQINLDLQCIFGDIYIYIQITSVYCVVRFANVRQHEL